MSETFFSSSGGLTEEVVSILTPIYNNSSVGQTYTDAAGDTYAELTNQTRPTMPSRLTGIGLVASAHVNAGTGTFQLWNQTDSASISTTTTTATSEAVISIGEQFATTNNNDSVTLRVKNSVAGNTVTLDFGGILIADRQLGLTAVQKFDLTVGNSTNTSVGCFLVRNIKLIVAKKKSTATFTIEVGSFLRVPGSSSGADFGNIYGTYTDVNNGTVNSIVIADMFQPNSSMLLNNLFNVTAVLDSSSLAIGVTYDVHRIKLF